MHRTLFHLFLLCCTPFAFAQGDPLAGKLKSDTERCQECHGIDGNADMGDGVGNIGKFPKLAGQRAEYLLKQLRDFRSGARQDEYMSVMVPGLKDEDLLDIVAYFASLPVMQNLSAKADTESALYKKGRTLYTRGDLDRNLLPCQSCHGDAGKKGSGPELPILGGQHVRYLQKQLLAWRSSERKNDESDTMNPIAKSLTEEEIEAISDYLSKQ
jgi:cytochrome c553